MTAQSFPASLAVGLLFTATLCAQSSVPTDSTHYYEGLTYNFIASAPRADTFYYNDFNRYKVSYSPGAFEAQVTHRYFGSAGGTGGDSDYSGAAIIGTGRSTIIDEKIAPIEGWKVRAPGVISGSGMNLKRTSSSTSINPYDPAVNDLSISGDDFPAGSSGHKVGTNDNTISFYSDAPGDQNGSPAHARFGISTAGYENIQLSFDIGVGIDSSANYRLMVGYYTGEMDENQSNNLVTWVYTENFYDVSTGWTAQLTFDFSDYSELDDNASFVFQMISIRGESGLWENVDGRTPSDEETGADVGALNLAFDRITLSGDAIAIPEPATAAALLGLVVGAVACRRRRRAG